jgi:hypothetical protein
LLEARILIARGDRQAAMARLSELVAVRSPAGAEAAVMLADLAELPATNADLQPVSLRLDLGALALMHRDTPLGARAFLGEAEVTGRFIGRDAAFDLLDFGHSARIISEDVYRDALASLGVSLEQLPADTPLALVYEANPQRFAQTLENADFRMNLARSYFGLGAPGLGEAVLLPADFENTVLIGDLAASHLEIGNASSAETFATMLPEGPVRAGIDAGIAIARGDAKVALARLTAAGASASLRARAAWAAEDWPASASALAEAIALPDPGAEPLSATGPIDSLDAVSVARRSAANQATRLALAAFNSGRGTAPPEALTLAGDEPVLSAGLRAIFARPEESPVDRSPAAIADYLEMLSAEAHLFEEILNDG